MPRFQRAGEKPQKTGRRFETFWASLFGVKPVKGSGSLWYAKLDVADGGSILWSCKHTDDASFRVSKALFREAEDAVIGQGGVGGETIPGLAVSVDGEVIVALKAEDFLRMFKKNVKWIEPSKGEQKRARSQIPAILREGSEDVK